MILKNAESIFVKYLGFHTRRKGVQIYIYVTTTMLFGEWKHAPASPVPDDLALLVVRSRKWLGGQSPLHKSGDIPYQSTQRH